MTRITLKKMYIISPLVLLHLLLIHSAVILQLFIKLYSKIQHNYSHNTVQWAVKGSHVAMDWYKHIILIPSLYHT